MTENEAIECLKCYRAQSGTSFPEEIEMAVNALEEIEQYRAIGTPEECREAVEKQKDDKELESHDEKHILKYCISLMRELVGSSRNGTNMCMAKMPLKNCVKMKSFVTECHISISFKNCFF